MILMVVVVRGEVCSIPPYSKAVEKYGLSLAGRMVGACSPAVLKEVGQTAWAA